MIHKVLVSLLLILFSQSYANSDITPLSAPQLTLVTESYPPYQYLDNEQIKGWSVDIIEPILNEANIPYQMSMYPWARAYQSALTNENTLIFSLMRIDIREDIFHWLIPLCTLEMAYYSHRDRTDINISKPSDIARYRVGIERAQAKKHYLVNLGYEEKLVEVNNNSQLRLMMEHKRIDLIMASSDFITNLISQGKIAPQELIKQLTIPELNKTLYLAANKTLNKDIVTKIKTAYQSVAHNIKRPCLLAQSK